MSGKDTVAKKLVLSAIVISILFVTSAVPSPIKAANNSVTPGVPNLVDLPIRGSNLAAAVEQSPQFKALSNGTSYGIIPGSSFGFMTGPNTTPTVFITYFSPNRMAYITAEVNNDTEQIEQMYFTNDTTTRPSWG